MGRLAYAPQAAGTQTKYNSMLESKKMHETI